MMKDGKLSGKSGKGRPRLTSESTVSKILEGHVKRIKALRRSCMKRLMTVDKAKEVCRDRRVWRSVLSDYLACDKACSQVKLSS